MQLLRITCLLTLTLLAKNGLAQTPSPEQLTSWIQRFPEADTNLDGVLTAEEALAYREVLRQRKPSPEKGQPTRGAPREFEVHPDWESSTFPEDAVFRRSPAEIAALYAEKAQEGTPPVTAFEKSESGALRIVGTGHSFMTPGYRTLRIICNAAGFEQPLFTHTGGGVTGSARYKWEQENGIFSFEGKPLPKLLASIANAEWDVMMWGPYFNDRPAYYACWIDFCLKYNPDMKFYLSDAWPQLYQFEVAPESETVFTEALLEELGRERSADYNELIETLRQDYPDRVFILPTSDAMVLAAKHFLRGELPGIEGLHSAVGEREERALWRDPLGHLGPGFDRLEGYVFYATLYGKSPETIEGDIDFGGDPTFPSQELDRMFRKIAWEAVLGNRLSGVSPELD